MSLRFAFVSVLAIACPTAGCTSADFASADPAGDDGSVDSSGGDTTGDAGDPDAGRDAPDRDTTPTEDAPVSCVGKPDGTPCFSADGKRRICVAEGCKLSICGDRIVDPGYEECDDGNEVANDGCEPATCKFSCRGASECPSTTCIVGRTCDSTHKCTAGTFAPKTTPCTTTTGKGGFCNSGVCASASCGNKTIELPEECDDGDGDPTNGCKNDCTYTCKVPSDCSDGNACNGAESCNVSSHTCAGGTPPTCDDSNPCTANTCAAATGCSNPFLDGDGDGFAPGARGTCGGSFAGKDGDCNDGNNAVKPGATETCDNNDNDCDGAVDEGITRHCYTGTPASTEGVGICRGGTQTCSAGVFSTTCSGEQTPITAFQTVAHPSGSWDYNCDGTVEQSVPNMGKCQITGGPCVVKTPGWLGDGSGTVTIPPCGASGSMLAACQVVEIICEPDSSISTPNTQACR